MKVRESTVVSALQVTRNESDGEKQHRVASQFASQIARNCSKKYVQTEAAVWIYSSMDTEKFDTFV